MTRVLDERPALESVNVLVYDAIIPFKHQNNQEIFA